LAPPASFRPRLARAHLVLGSDQVENVHFEQFGPAVARELLDRQVDREKARVQIRNEHRIPGMLEQVGVARLACPERSLGDPLVGHVAK